jgi:hypothetical protein
MGFRNVSGNSLENNPIFDTSLLNKNFANNLANVEFEPSSAGNFGSEKNAGFKSARQDPNMTLGNMMQQVGISSHVSGGQVPTTNVLNPNNTQSSQPPRQNPPQPNPSQPPTPNLSTGFNLANINTNPYGTLYEGSSFNPIGMSNWLSSIRSNNGNLFENMQQSLPDQLLHKANLDRYMQSEQQQKLLDMARSPLPSDDPNSVVCLIQQINLYKELLSQVTYQNQLLSRDIQLKQQSPMQPFGTIPGLNFLNSMSMNPMAMGMGNLGGLPGMNPLSSVPSVMGNGFISPDLMNSHMSVLNNLMLTQANNRQIDAVTKEKEVPIVSPLVGAAQSPSAGLVPPVGSNGGNGQTAGGLGGMGGNGGSLLGIDPHELERIKSMLKEELKR